MPRNAMAFLLTPERLPLPPARTHPTGIEDDPESELSWRLQRAVALKAAAEKRRLRCQEWAGRRGLTLETVQDIYTFLLQLMAVEVTSSTAQSINPVTEQHTSLRARACVCASLCQADSLARAEEIRQFVFSRLTQEDAPLVPAMLKWLTVESQYDDNNKHVRRLLRKLEGGDTEEDEEPTDGPTRSFAANRSPIISTPGERGACRMY